MSDTADLLAGVPLLSGLDRKQLEKLALDFSERTFPAGSTVVREGDEHGIGFFVVADGEGVVSVGGKEVARQAGAMGAADIVRWTQSQLSRASTAA